MRILLFICFGLSSSIVIAQSEIAVTGKVVNAITGKGIKAKIFYQSLPTGGINGRVNDSTFKLGIFDAKYQITAEAPGYLPSTVIIDPKAPNTGREIVRNIPLTPEGQTVELKTMNFELGSATIKSESYAELDEVVAMMKTNEKMVIQLEGHTDIAGDPGKNKELSQDRVVAIQKYMVSKGVQKSRIKTKAFGGTQPISKDRSQESQKANRRVEMRVLSH